jgi:DHA3 family macrolide efflux protein-like MFS transporter
VRTFITIWFGQLISMVGSGLTGFALSVYIYQETGSATQLGLSLLSATLPSLLMSPLAGVLVDRRDRRWVMLLSDTGAGLSTLAIWLLLRDGHLAVWHIYLANAANSALGAFQRPAFMASTTLLVPKRQYGRAAGLGQLGAAISQIVSPLLAGFLIGRIEIQGVILIDFATYLVAALSLLVVRIPRPAAPAAEDRGRGTLVREAGYGLAYLRKRPGLMGLLVLFAFCNFTLGLYSVLFTPLVLSFSTADALGGVLSAGGFGMLAGSLVMSGWGGARRKVDSLLGALMLAGAFLGLAGLRPDPFLVGIAAFGFFFLVPIANGSSQAIWLAKVAPEVQGRVFATRAMMATVANPLAYLLAGPLVDYLFGPLMAADGVLRDSAGVVIGVGPGRGIGLLFVTVGLLMSMATALAYLYPRVRLLEEELPDCVSAAATQVAV